MAIVADLDRVFEIGPVFRAENSNTPRHLTEFTGLDMEMQIKQHYHEVLDVIEDMFMTIFEGLSTQYKHELVIGKWRGWEGYEYLIRLRYNDDEYS